MPRQTRSKGGDPDLADGKFWTRKQTGAAKDKVKGLAVDPGPHNSFITFKIPVDKYEFLDIDRPRRPSAADVFWSRKITPGKQTQSVELRKDSRANSAFAIDTPATNIAPSESAVAQCTGAQRSGSRPAGYQTPPRPPVSPITPSSQISKISPVIAPHQETLSHNTDQDIESQVTATVGQAIQLGFGRSLENGIVESKVGANERTIEAELGTSLQQSRNYPSIYLPVSDPSSVFQQTYHSLEPSPKTVTQSFEPQPLVLFPQPVTYTKLDTTSDSTHPIGKIDGQKLIVSSLNEYCIDQQDSGPVSGHHPPGTHQISVTSGSYSQSTEPAASPANSDVKPILASPKKRSRLKRQRSSTPSLACEEIPHVKRKPGRPSKSSAQKPFIESAQQFRPSLIVKLPIKKGYILDENMAPVRDPQDVSSSLKEIVQNMFDTTQTVVGYVPQSQDLLIDRMAELTQNLAHLQNITNLNTSPNNPIHNIRIAPEIVDYVDDGRNPDIFTRDFVELVQRGNAVMNGKKKAFNSFAEIYARELKKGIRGVDKQVDLVMENAGLSVGDEEEHREKDKEKGHENGGSFKNT